MPACGLQKIGVKPSHSKAGDWLVHDNTKASSTPVVSSIRGSLLSPYSLAMQSLIF
jgi:hypothetical protein